MNSQTTPTIEELLKILLTVDGKGKAAKKEALKTLLSGIDCRCMDYAFESIEKIEQEIDKIE